MSAWIVPHNHINALLTYASKQKFLNYFYLNGERHLDTQQDADLQKAAEILVAENYRSFNYRYDETTPPPPITFRRYPPPPNTYLSPVEILKACDCYDYQACETDGYHQSDAAKIVDQIRHNAIANLPGWEQADCWPIN